MQNKKTHKTLFFIMFACLASSFLQVVGAENDDMQQVYDFARKSAKPTIFIAGGLGLQSTALWGSMFKKNALEIVEKLQDKDNKGSYASEKVATFLEEKVEGLAQFCGRHAKALFVAGTACVFFGWLTDRLEMWQLENEKKAAIEVGNRKIISHMSNIAPAISSEILHNIFNSSSREDEIQAVRDLYESAETIQEGLRGWRVKDGFSVESYIDGLRAGSE